MKLIHVLTATAVVLLSTAPCAHAQTQAPGLWEHTFTMKSQGGEMERAMEQMQQQMDAMPPEQRRKVEEMMASRGAAMGAKGTSAKVCLTKEQAAKPAEPQLNADCNHHDLIRSGNTVKYRFECSKPHPVHGEGELTYAGDKAYSGTSTVTTLGQGQPQQMRMEMSGKWLSADCGAIKPIALPAK